MKFKKFLALSLAAAMMTTGVGVGGLENIFASTAVDLGSVSWKATDNGYVYSTTGTQKGQDSNVYGVSLWTRDSKGNITWLTSADVTNCEYTGSNQMPKVEITSYGGDTGETTDDTIVPASEYTVTYEKQNSVTQNWDVVNSMVDAGTYRIVIEGNGSEYTGRKEFSFTIATKKINTEVNSIAGSGIYVDNGNYDVVKDSDGDDVILVEDDGATSVPDLGVFDVIAGKANRLKEGSDYTITGAASNALGAYTATIAGSGNYDLSGVSGGVTKDYAIVHSLKKSEITIGVDASKKPVSIVMVDGKFIEPTAYNANYFDSAKNDKNNFDGTMDSYSVEYYDSTGASKGNNSNLQALNPGTYKAKVVGTGCYYTAEPIEITFTVGSSPAVINGSSVSGTYSYNGKPVTPTLNVTSTANTLISNGYYVIAGQNNKVSKTTLTADLDLDGDGNNDIDQSSAYYLCVGDGVHTIGFSYNNFAITQANIGEATVSNIPNKTYTGSIIKPNLSVSYAGNTLTAGIDYTYTVSKIFDRNGDGEPDKTADGRYIPGTDVTSSLTNAGTYVVEVTGVTFDTPKDTFGKNLPIQKLFTIDKADISDYSVTIGSDNVIVANSSLLAGSAINFSSTKVYKGSNDLNYGVDFEVSSENTKLLGGKYTATVKAKDGSNYKGTIENIEYTVLEELYNTNATTYNTSVYIETEANADGTYTYTPKVLANSAGKILTEGVDYNVSYYESNGSSAFGSAVSTFASGKTYKAIITGAEGSYYTGSDASGKTEIDFSIDAYSEKTDLSKGEITINANSSYTGSPVTADFVVSLNGKTINKKYYTVAYENNIDAGNETATVTVVGTNGYSGKISKTYTIDPKSIADTNSTPDLTVSAEGYTGFKIVPELVFDDDAIALSTEKDSYDVAYYNVVRKYGEIQKNPSTGRYILGDKVEEITDAGTYVVVVTGKNNYKDSVETLFNVSQGDISILNVSADDVVYTGEAVTPTFKFTNKDGETIDVKESEYVMTYYTDSKCTSQVKEVIDEGTYYAKLAGKGNFSSSSQKVVKFNVVAGTDISDAKITAVGTDEKPELLVVVDGKVLTLDKDYTVEYVIAEDGKTGTATITGIGEYVGTATATYEIKKDIVALSKASIKLSKTSYGYNGKAKKPGVTVKVDGVTVDPSEYTVSYSNNKNAGTGKVTITAKDDSEVIKGSKTMTITIAKASNKVTASNVTKSYKVKTLKAKKATFKLSAKAKAGKLSYKKVSSGKKIAVSKNGTVTVAKGLKKGTYKVKVKVTAASSTNYKAASKTMTVTVKVK